MKTNLLWSGAKVLVTACGFLLLLTAGADSAVAQTNTFPASGNAGIGTTTPASPLVVSGNEPSADYATVRVKPTVTHGGIVIDSANNSSQVHLRFYKNGVPKWQFRVPFQDGTEHLRLFSWTANADVMSISPDGNIGIGTTAPTGLLDLASATQTNSRLLLSGQEFFAAGNTSTSGIALRLGVNRPGERQIWFADSSQAINATNSQLRMRFFSSSASLDALTTDGNATRPLILQSFGGNVGIGTALPLQKLQIGSNTVSGSTTPDVVSLGGTYSSTARVNPKLRLFDNNGGVIYGLGVSDNQLDFMIPSAARYVWSVNGIEKMRLDDYGNITIAGTIAAKYQDLAEWVECSQALTSGTVVVLDQTKSNQVIASTLAYDTRVAGVISLQPGITLGENGPGKVMVATTGRVKIKVDASRGKIQIGDLLVTSDMPGVAMKSQPIDVGGVQIHRPGTLIGKALEPLSTGVGEILVLLSLQ